MAELRAVLWDVDGTLAETERDGHRVAFNRAFETCGVSWRWDESRYGELVRVSGGLERLLHDMDGHPEAPVVRAERLQLARRIHVEKNIQYAAIASQGGIPLRPGVEDLLRQCLDEGILLGIATTTSRSNVEALLRSHLGGGWQRMFSAVITGEDVQHKKPDPEVYGLALRQLSLDPLEVVAIEDSPGGAASACAAHVPVIVTRSSYFLGDAIEGAIAIGPGLGTRAGWTPGLRPGTGEEDRVRLEDVAGWWEQRDSISQFGSLSP